MQPDTHVFDDWIKDATGEAIFTFFTKHGKLECVTSQDANSNGKDWKNSPRYVNPVRPPIQAYLCLSPALYVIQLNQGTTCIF